jgi:hypothetical protein
VLLTIGIDLLHCLDNLKYEQNDSQSGNKQSHIWPLYGEDRLKAGVYLHSPLSAGSSKHSTIYGLA